MVPGDVKDSMQARRAGTPGSHAYGKAVDYKVALFYVAFGSNEGGVADPKILATCEFTLPDFRPPSICRPARRKAVCRRIAA